MSPIPMGVSSKNKCEEWIDRQVNASVRCTHLLIVHLYTI